MSLEVIPDGVWVVWSHSDGIVVSSIHQREIDALRAAVADGYSKVTFVPFGKPVSEVLA